MTGPGTGTDLEISTAPSSDCDSESDRRRRSDSVRLARAVADSESESRPAGGGPRTVTVAHASRSGAQPMQVKQDGRWVTSGHVPRRGRSGSDFRDVRVGHWRRTRAVRTLLFVVFETKLRNLRRAIVAVLNVARAAALPP